MDDLELAHLLADEAATISLAHFGPVVAHEAKADGSPVTAADLEVSAAIIDLLAEHRPGDGVLSEEHGERPATTGRRWIVDPIDGTAFFMAGQLGWTNLIALEVDGALEVGVVGGPASDVRYSARRGGGTLVTPTVRGLRSGEGVTARMSALTSLVDAMFTTAAPTPSPALDRLRSTCAWSAPDAFLLARLLAGELDVFLAQGGAVWDHAAHVIVIEEAGGRFRDPEGGRRLDLEGGTYAAASLDAELGALLGRW